MRGGTVVVHSEVREMDQITNPTPKPVGDKGQRWVRAHGDGIGLLLPCDAVMPRGLTCSAEGSPVPRVTEPSSLHS